MHVFQRMEPVARRARHTCVHYVARADLIVEQIEAAASEARLAALVTRLPAEERTSLCGFAHARFDAVEIIALTLAPSALVGPLLAALRLALVFGAAGLALEICVTRPGVGIFGRRARGRLVGLRRLRRG